MLNSDLLARRPYDPVFAEVGRPGMPCVVLACPFAKKDRHDAEGDVRVGRAGGSRLNGIGPL